MAEDVVTALDGGVLAVTLARPAKKNATSDRMYQALAEALQRARADADVRVVLVRGSGGAFTAGNDLADFLPVAAGGRTPQDLAVFGFLHALADLD